jgi:putative transposase
MYDWRKMTLQERDAVLNWRTHNCRPQHSPPHSDNEQSRNYLLSAACYEHKPIIILRPERIHGLVRFLKEICGRFCKDVHAWCILPNHYHLLVTTEHIADLLRDLGQLHGRTSRMWNLEEHCTGRKVWFNCADRRIRSERHFWASVNYIHHNPVKHGYCEQWTDWPFSSATEFLSQVGREKAIEIWKAYPILDYGEKWDY